MNILLRTSRLHLNHDPDNINTNGGLCVAVFHVRPAWARSWRWKSSRELTTTNEVKRNCARVTERGEEASNVNREPMDKNRIRGGAEQGERA